MNKIIILMIGSLIGFTGCKSKQQKIIAEESPSEIIVPYTLESYSERELIQNADLVHIINCLQQSGNNFKTVGRNLEHQLKWQKECTEALVGYYNSHYQVTEISQKKKVNIVLDKILTLYESAYGSVRAIEIRAFENYLNQYIILSLYKEYSSTTEGDRIKKVLKNEMNHWISFVNSFNDYNYGVIALYHFGGSACGSLPLLIENKILVARINEQNKILCILKNEGNQDLRSFDRDRAQKIFNLRISNTITRVYDVTAFDFDEISDKERIDLYHTTFKETKRDALIFKAHFSAWCTARMEVEEALHENSDQLKAYSNVTVRFIDELSSIFQIIIEN